jgi:hypothetical protein
MALLKKPFSFKLYFVAGSCFSPRPSLPFSQRDRPKFVGTKDRQAAKFVGGLKIRDGASEGQTTHITHHPPPLSRYCIVRYHHLAIITKISPWPWPWPWPLPPSNAHQAIFISMMSPDPRQWATNMRAAVRWEERIGQGGKLEREVGISKQQ